MLDLGLGDVHVLVTGASGGIGIEISRLFLEQRVKLTAQYNTNPKTLSALISRFGPERIHAIQADLCSEDSVEALFLFAIALFGPVSSPKNSCETSHDQATSRKAQASIIFVGSNAGKYGEAMHADYAASKSALMYGLTLSLKNEIVSIAPRARVNCVAPGWVRTPMTEEALRDSAVVSSAPATIPLKKIGMQYDVATQIVWLASNRTSGHVTGQIVDIIGGEEGFVVNL